MVSKMKEVSRNEMVKLADTKNHIFLWIFIVRGGEGAQTAGTVKNMPDVIGICSSP